MTRLDGSVVLVSGGGTGIGAACARLAAREGGRVVVTGRRAEPIQSVADEIGGVAIVGDTRDPDHAASAVAAAVDRFGRLDALIVNAGIGAVGSVGATTDEEWRETHSVNLDGAMVFARAALPALVKSGRGAIVFVASVNGIVNTPNSAAYDTSKAAVIALARSIAVDYGPRGVRSNAVCPGWVATPMADDDMDIVAVRRGVTRSEAYGMVSAHVPLRRVARPEEVAASCVFLASADASFITGTTLVVDGGGLAVDVTGTAFA